jgi:hypothetical protein
MDYNKITNIEFEGIDYRDSPDFSDAHIISAEYEGEEMTDEQIQDLNENSDFVYSALMDYLN